MLTANGKTEGRTPRPKMSYTSRLWVGVLRKYSARVRTANLTVTEGGAGDRRTPRALEPL